MANNKTQVSEDETPMQRRYNSLGFADGEVEAAEGEPDFGDEEAEDQPASDYVRKFLGYDPDNPPTDDES